MKILILEDSVERIRKFKKELIKHDLYFFDNVEEAKEAINLLGNFDMLFLDHDLDHEIYVDSEQSNTGYQLAKWIKNNNIKFDDIVVHSMNPVGAQNIKNILPEAKIIPFIDLF